MSRAVGAAPQCRTSRGVGWPACLPTIIRARPCRRSRGKGSVDRTITLTASLTPEEGGYVARCLELPVVTGGATVEGAGAMPGGGGGLSLGAQPLPEQPPHP